MIPVSALLMDIHLFDAFPQRTKKKFQRKTDPNTSTLKHCVKV